MIRFINYDEFNPEHVTIGDSTEKEARNGAMKYSIRKIRYGYGEKNGGEGSLLIQGPKFTSSSGIIERQVDGRLIQYISVRIEPDNREHQLFLEKMIQLRRRLFSLMINKPVPEDYPEDKMTVASIVYYPQDDNKIKIEGAIPRFYFPLLNFGEGTNKSMTIFTGMDKCKMSWLDLYGVIIEFVPIFRVDSLVKAKDITVRKYLITAVIKSLKPKELTDLQYGTIDKIIEEDPEAVAKFKEQLEVIKRRKEQSDPLMEGGCGDEQTNEETNEDDEGDNLDSTSFQIPPKVSSTPEDILDDEIEQFSREARSKSFEEDDEDVYNILSSAPVSQTLQVSENLDSPPRTQSKQPSQTTQRTQRTQSRASQGTQKKFVTTKQVH